MFDFLFNNEPHCHSCRRCLNFQDNSFLRRDIPTYIVAPKERSCWYLPTSRGGCENFKPIIGGRNFFINSFRDSATPKPGSVVVCDLRFTILPGVDHSGIVDDVGLILHMDGELGVIRSNPRDFVNRLNGWNGAMSIYVACRRYEAIGNEEAFKRGEKALLEDPHFDDYDLFTNNCHQFVQYCLTGKRDASFTFSALESELCQYHEMDNWRKWDVKLYED